MKLPDLPSRVGRIVKLKIPPKGHILKCEIVDEIRMPQTGLESKILVLKKVRFPDNHIEIRLGYYIIGKKPGALGRWVWGQYSTLLPPEDIASMFNKAVEQGWINST